MACLATWWNDHSCTETSQHALENCILHRTDMAMYLKVRQLCRASLAGPDAHIAQTRKSSTAGRQCGTKVGSQHSCHTQTARTAVGLPIGNHHSTPRPGRQLLLVCLHVDRRHLGSSCSVSRLRLGAAVLLAAAAVAVHGAEQPPGLCDGPRQVRLCVWVNKFNVACTQSEAAHGGVV